MSLNLETIPSYSDREFLRDMFTEIHQLGELGHLCIHVDGGCITYALYSGSPNYEQELLYKGYGFEGLGEMRHTYFANKGYMFYLEVPLLEASFQILRKYFKYDELS